MGACLDFIYFLWNVTRFFVLVLEWATRNSKTQRALTLKTQTRLNSSSKKPEKLILLEPKLKIIEQKSSLIHARTRQFETLYKVWIFKAFWKFWLDSEPCKLLLLDTRLEFCCKMIIQNVVPPHSRSNLFKFSISTDARMQIIPPSA